jgi:hypothetical protein
MAEGTQTEVANASTAIMVLRDLIFFSLFRLTKYQSASVELDAPPSAKCCAWCELWSIFVFVVRAEWLPDEGIFVWKSHATANAALSLESGTCLLILAD